MNATVLNIPVYSRELCKFYSIKPTCILIDFCLFAGQDDAEGESLYCVFIHQMSLILYTRIFNCTIICHHELDCVSVVSLNVRLHADTNA